MKLLDQLKIIATSIKRDVLTVYFAARDKRTPLLVRLLALVIAAYAVSPIDLIPDFIPVLGYLDDLILLPLGIALVIKLIPGDVLETSREQAANLDISPRSTLAAVVIVSLWVSCSVIVGYWLVGWINF